MKQNIDHTAKDSKHVFSIVSISETLSRKVDEAESLEASVM